MPRFSSLEHSLPDTRRILRDRLVRYLPSDNVESVGSKKSIELPDESLLSLLLNLTIHCASDLSVASAAHANHRSPVSTEPPLSKLNDDGWLQLVWGRIGSTSELARVVRTTQAAEMPALARLLEGFYTRTYKLAAPPDADTALTAAARAVQNGELLPHQIGCKTPTWVAARLWDRAISNTQDASAAFRLWVDRWRELWFPSIIPGKMWSDEDASTFRETAFSILGAEADFLDWNKRRAQLVRQASLEAGSAEANLDHWLPQIPVTLLDRALWLGEYSVERTMLGGYTQFEDLANVVRLLLLDVEADDHSGAPHPIARRLFDLAVDRPDLLHILLLQIRSRPILLADLLLYPRTSALASWLIGRWSSSYSAYDRDLTDQDNHNTKITAFTDAASVMGFYLDRASLDSPEAASLLRVLHRIDAAQTHQHGPTLPSLLPTLHGELRRLDPSVRREILSALSREISVHGLDTFLFGAVADVLDISTLSPASHSESLIESYLEALARHDPRFSTDRLSVTGAASFFELSAHASQSTRCKFLHPFDTTVRFNSGVPTEDLARAHNRADSLRVHIRVLCRSVVGLGQSAPNDLLAALVEAVHDGALQHHEKGRVSAFSPNYEAGVLSSPTVRPIADDLGFALRTLTGRHRSDLLDAILETDEPLLLAQLTQKAPLSALTRIERRIAALTPDTAGSISSLTEAQARVDGLLSAELPDAASRFLAAEQALQTWGAVRGRELTRLQYALRLKLLQADWRAIDQADLPEEIDLNERQTALDTLTFYKALAALRNPEGDKDAAEKAFSALHRRRRDVASYALNLIATRIVLLLKDPSFVRLQGPNIGRGRTLLGDAEQMMQGFPDSDRDGFLFNKALLLLAVGDTSKAHDLLMTVSRRRPSENCTAYLAVARARLGRLNEAVAILDQAADEFGKSELLSSARGHILGNESILVNPSTAWEGDVLPRIRNAIQDLKQLDPHRQAIVLSPLSGSIEELLLLYVRSAASSVMSLVPMMKETELDKCEDDITDLLRELLIARVDFLEWSVSDQSRGGFTGGPRAGERDLVLTRGASTIAVIEAAVFGTRTAWTRIREHFLKLFGYSTCPSLFLVIYAHRGDLASAVERLKELARDGAPSGFVFANVRDLRHEDSGPAGFVAYFTSELGEVRVVFLLLDMAQVAQRKAASTARQRRTP